MKQKNCSLDNNHKRILYITYYYPPEIGAGSYRAEQITKDLAKEYVIDVITNTPTYPRRGMYSSDKTEEVDRYLLDKGIFTFRISNFGSINLIFRAAAYLLFVLRCSMKSLWMIFFNRYQAIVTTSPPLFVLLPGLLINRLTSARWILEVRDLWPDIIVELGKLSKTGFAYKILSKLEKTAYQSCCQIVTVTDGFKDYLVQEKGVPPEKISVIYNGIDKESLTPKILNHQEICIQKEQLGIKRTRVCGYIGNIGYAQGLEVVLEIARHCPDWHFLFCGDGPEKTRLVNMTQDISNITFLPSTDDKNLLDRIYSILDAGIVTLRNTPTLRLTIPSKIYGLIARKIPVLSINCPEITRICDCSALFNIDANDEAFITKAKHFLYNSKNHCISEDYSNLLLDRFSWNVLGKKYREIIK